MLYDETMFIVDVGVNKLFEYIRSLLNIILLLLELLGLTKEKLHTLCESKQSKFLKADVLRNVEFDREESE